MFDSAIRASPRFVRASPRKQIPKTLEAGAFAGVLLTHSRCERCPILQALLLADFVYVDQATGKKVIAGVFDSLLVMSEPPQEPETEFPQNEGEPAKKRVPVKLCAEPEGGFSVYAPDLPGVVSQGETEQEALANTREAFQGVAEVYREIGTTIPWQQDNEDKPSGAKELWVLVDA